MNVNRPYRNGVPDGLRVAHDYRSAGLVLQTVGDAGHLEHLQGCRLDAWPQGFMLAHPKHRLLPLKKLIPGAPRADV